ncbi:MAG TPA: hypothetical protein PK293_10955 [Spirochaetota bacterium]|nr:hypothetical protein [Spirochaetota bacterium]HPF06546.1 hypothetical protein [Spirochaetota bacterium]HPJ41675.1 hypothetical protein [Spirochaetota bacterium]HPR38242.1 hypothetical protein [Spirochaetota bacterium]
MIIKIILWVNLSLLLLHEMDAVRTMEWKMMAVINRIDDSIASCIFIGMHFVLFIIIFYLLEYHFSVLYWIISIFPLLHQLLHIFFRKHPANRMNNIFSRGIITLMTLSGSAGIVTGIICNY